MNSAFKNDNGSSYKNVKASSYKNLLYRLERLEVRLQGYEKLQQGFVELCSIVNNLSNDYVKTSGEIVTKVLSQDEINAKVLSLCDFYLREMKRIKDHVNLSDDNVDIPNIEDIIKTENNNIDSLDQVSETNAE